MKFIIYALVATICVLEFASAKNSFLEGIESDFDKTYNWFDQFFSRTFKNLQKNLNEAKGVLCLMPTIETVGVAAVHLPSELDACGFSWRKDHGDIEAGFTEIHGLAGEIVAIKENDCNWLSNLTPQGCYWKLLNKFWQLKTVGDKLLDNTKTAAGKSEDLCLRAVFDKVESKIPRIETNIKKCAKVL